MKGELVVVKVFRRELKGVNWLKSKYKISVVGDLLNYFISKYLNCLYDLNNLCIMERFECFYCFRK